MPLLAPSFQTSHSVAKGAPAARHGPGIQEATSRYGLSPGRFADLKSTDPQRQAEALRALEDTVRLGNNLQSLDLLIDIARGDNEAGRLAESMVFDLFAHPPRGHEWLAGEATQRVAQAHDRPRHHAEPDKLGPDARGGKLLYMAGSQASPATRASLSKQFAHLDPGPDLWSKSRPISSGELNADRAANKQLGKNFGAATTLEAHQYTSTPDWKFTPLEVQGKWVLVGERNTDGLGEAVIFSPHKLDAYDREVLDNSWFKVKFIEAPMAERVPGGSGVFVRAARADLANELAQGKDPVATLEMTAKAFSRMSTSDCDELNTMGRRRLHAALLEHPPQAAPRPSPLPSARASQKQIDRLQERSLHTQLQGLLKETNTEKSIKSIVKKAHVDDSLGRTAEALLFAAFTHPTEKSVPAKIAKGILQEGPDAKAVTPAQLLSHGGKLFYMAGSEMKEADKAILSGKFCKALGLDEEFKHIWSPDRAISVNEMNAHIDALKKAGPNSQRIRPAQPLADYQPPELTKNWQAIPIDLGDKWVLALERLAEGSSTEKETRIFSPGPLSSDDRDFLAERGLEDPHPIVGEPNTALENASGVLVNGVLKNFVSDPRQLDNPVDLLSRYAKALPGKQSKQAFESFNLQRRHEMMGALIDSKSAVAPEIAL